jgi:hypothetical protein
VAKTATIAQPLTDSDLTDINRAQYILNQLLAQLDKAEQAGRDVTDLRLRRDDLANQIAQIKSAYFPQSQ